MAEFAIGQKAVVFQATTFGGICSPVTVERDTKLYWVADGRKFRKADGLEPGSNKNWDRGRYLLPLDDRRVVEAMTKARKQNAYGLVEDAQIKLNRDRESVHAIRQLRKALEAYAETLQQLDQVS